VISDYNNRLVAKIPGWQIPAYDYIGVTYPNGTTEVYVYKVGGASGTAVGTLTVVYTDSTKTSMSSSTLS
jgi:hypothetical protein